MILNALKGRASATHHCIKSCSRLSDPPSTAWQPGGGETSQ
jgi:hypothetical protein